MAQNDFLKRYVDLGVEYAQLTQKRAEAIARDLVKQGEIRQEQVQETVQGLLDESRKRRKKFATQIRAEIKDLGLATKADVRRLERQIDKLTKDAKKSAPAKKTAAKKAAPKKKAS